MAISDVSGLRIAVVCPYAMDVPGGVQSHAHGLAAHLRAGGAARILDVYAEAAEHRPAARGGRAA